MYCSHRSSCAVMQVDYEVELAVVIGKPCKDVSEEKALDYVLGFTCANDVRCVRVLSISVRSCSVLQCALVAVGEGSLVRCCRRSCILNHARSPAVGSGAAARPSTRS